MRLNSQISRLTCFLLAVVLSTGAVGCNSTQGDTTSQTAPSQNAEPSPAPANTEATPPKPPDESNTAAKIEQKPSVTKPLPRLSSKGATRVEMRNVDFHTQDAVVLRIRTLRGALLRTRSSVPPVFDDKRSFALRIDSGTIGIRTDSLSELMNSYVFAYPHAPLKKIQITTKGNQIKMSAKMHKGVDVPVRITGDLTATPDGKLRLHPTSIKAAGLPVKGFLHLFGMDLSDVIKANEDRGVSIDDDDIIMDPERMMPAPAIRGKITAVRVEGDEVIQVFGPGAASRASSKGSNYMYYRGGTIRFGKLTMANADLRIVDAEPGTAFDFSIDHYNQQLVAGRSKSTPNFGLVVVMPDYYKIGNASRNGTTQSVPTKSGAQSATAPTEARQR
jgi:hypothetical protein